LTHAQLAESARTQAQHFDLESGNVWGLPLPWHHVGGLMGILRARAVNACVVVGKLPLDLSSLQFISLVPTQLKRLLPEARALAKLKAVVLGGAPLSTELRTQAHGVPVHDCYGLTEFAAMVMDDG